MDWDKFYKIGFFILIFFIAIGAAYYFGYYQNYLKILAISPTPASTEEPPPQSDTGLVIHTPAPTSKKMKLDEVKGNIKGAVESKNYAALEGYMTSSVSVILEATECCGSLSAKDTVKQLDYLNDAQAPWNFDQTNDTIKNLKTKEPTKYGPESAYVGIASNEYTVSFKFDANNKINSVTMAVTYKLILP